jgi:hypothetical protein
MAGKLQSLMGQFRVDGQATQESSSIPPAAKKTALPPAIRKRLKPGVLAEA